ncbi:MAG: hypothetical protein INR67_08255, partial [Jatrophihabitans endophyticus]|nr:hypothetical protein [Jatrophihabitans endophyticus]
MTQPTRPRVLARGAAVLAALALCFAGSAAASGASPARPASPTARTAEAQSVLGRNVVVFDPSMTTAQIQKKVDRIAAKQVTNQFGTQRYALLFEPGTYGSAADPLDFQVGFYTEVAGLGQN